MIQVLAVLTESLLAEMLLSDKSKSIFFLPESQTVVNAIAKLAVQM